MEDYFRTLARQAATNYGDGLISQSELTHAIWYAVNYPLFQLVK